MTWDEIWNSIATFFNTKGLVIFYAVLVLLLGYIIIRILLKIVKKFLSKSKLAPITQGFVNSILKVLLYVVLVFAVLQVLGVPITGLVTVLGTAGVAISLALKDSLSNVAYGMILITTKPFYQGDYVEIGGKEGTVKEIGIMSTEIITTDNKKIVIPNSTVYSSAIVNYSARGSRRIEMLFDVSYNTDLEKAKKIILDVCHSNGKIMLDPAPAVNLKYMADDNLSLFVTCWTKAPYWEVYYYIMDNVFNEFKRNGISIDYKQIEVRLREDTPKTPYRKASLPKRVEPKPEINEEFNIFDIESFKNLQNKGKQKHIKYLENKKKKLDEKLKNLKKDEPQAPHKDVLLVSKSVLIKKKARVSKFNRKANFTSKIQPKTTEKN